MTGNIIRTWAESAGITIHQGDTLRPVSVEDLHALVTAAVVAERGRCTELAERIAGAQEYGPIRQYCAQIADAIREGDVRGEP